VKSDGEMNKMKFKELIGLDICFHNMKIQYL